jgi:hypothetical protein
MKTLLIILLLTFLSLGVLSIGLAVYEKHKDVVLLSESISELSAKIRIERLKNQSLQALSEKL